MAFVTYDRKSKIKITCQTTGANCAYACAAMCVKKTIQELANDGFNTNGGADWYGVAQKYGYSSKEIGSSTLQLIYDYLKSGYPVITKVNDSSSHWVVVYKYAGDNLDIRAQDFTCADPWPPNDTTESNHICTLNNAVRYAGTYKIVIYS